MVKALPLWHAISLVRGLTLGAINLAHLSRVLYFLVMIVGGLFFTTRPLDALVMRYFAS